MLEQSVAGFGRRHAGSSSDDERRARKLFELCDPLADRRGGDVLDLRCLRNALAFAHGDKELQRREIELARHERCHHTANALLHPRG